MLIGELADAAGVTSQTIRFYERQGLVPDVERGANGYRVYDESMLARLRFINRAQAAGLTLAEIRSIVDLRDDGTAPCAHVVTLIDRKLADVRAKISHLAALQAELDALLDRSHLLDPADCADDDICHILSSPKQAAKARGNRLRSGSRVPDAGRCAMSGTSSRPPEAPDLPKSYG
jgi:MerR family mercuric resistance operon transcriptional regulator